MLYALLIFVAIVAISISIYLSIQIQRFRKNEILVSNEPTTREILWDSILESKQSESSRHPLEGISLSERDVGIFYGRAVVQKFYQNGQNRLPKVPQKLLDEFGVVEGNTQKVNAEEIIYKNLDPDIINKEFSNYEVKFS